MGVEGDGSVSPDRKPDGAWGCPTLPDLRVREVSFGGGLWTGDSRVSRGLRVRVSVSTPSTLAVRRRLTMRPRSGDRGDTKPPTRTALSLLWTRTLGRGACADPLACPPSTAADAAGDLAPRAARRWRDCTSNARTACICCSCLRRAARRALARRSARLSCGTRHTVRVSVARRVRRCVAHAPRLGDPTPRHWPCAQRVPAPSPS